MHSSKEKISIVIPNYNGGKYLRQCLDSIVSQSYLNKEIIVVDGYSTDDSLGIIESYNNITLVMAEPNGEADAINKGMNYAHGGILTFMDSDDYYLPGALTTVGDYFATYDKNWAYSAGKVVGADNKEARKLMMLIKTFLMKHYNYEVLKIVDFFLTPGVFWRKTLWEKIGNFRTDAKFVYEYEWWLRAGMDYKPGFINSNIGVWRMHKDSITSSNLKQNAVDALRLQGEYTDNPFTKLLQFAAYGSTRFIYVLENRK